LVQKQVSFDLLALAVLIEYWHPLNQQRQMMVFYCAALEADGNGGWKRACVRSWRELAEQTRNEKPRPGEVSASEGVRGERTLG